MAWDDFLRNNSQALLQGGIGLLGGKTASEQAAMGAQGFGNALQANKTMQFLQTANPELAQAVGNGTIAPGDAFKLYYQQKLESQKPRNSLLPVGKNLYDFANNKWIAPPAGVGGDEPEFGLNPIWGKDENGNTVLGQVSKNGKFQKLDTGGFIPTPTLQNIDTGTGTLSQNSRTGEVVRVTPKNIAGAETQKVIGKDMGEAIVSLPGTEGFANTITKGISDLKNDPYLPKMTGWNDYKMDITPDAKRVRGKIEKLRGGAFLSAREWLKGQGPITDFESRRAEAANSRMDTALTTEDFNDALDEFNSAVQSGVEKVRRRAQGHGSSGGSASPSQGANPYKNRYGLE